MHNGGKGIVFGIYDPINRRPKLYTKNTPTMTQDENGNFHDNCKEITVTTSAPKRIWLVPCENITKRKLTPYRTSF